MHSKLRHLIWFGLAFGCYLATSLSAMQATAAADRWTVIGPDGANVVALIVDPHSPATAFAGTLGSGVLKTTDGGTTWATANGALPTVNVSALAFDPSTPSTLFAGTDVGAFKSTDGAQSWVAINDGLLGAQQAYFSISALSVDSGTPSILYAATSSGLFKTNTAAVNWTSINASKLRGYTPRVVAVDPASPPILYAGADNYDGDGMFSGVFKSTDAGTTWEIILGDENGATPATVAIAIDPLSPSRIYVALFGGGVWRSGDGGKTWSSTNEPVANVVSLAIDPAAPSTLYAGIDRNSIVRTGDGGDHWTFLTTGGRQTVLAVSAAPGLVYAGSATGILRSMDSGSTWMRPTLGVRNVSAYPVTTDPVSSSTIYSSLNGVVTRSTDGGNHWADVATVPALSWVNFILFDPASPSTIYIGGRGIDSDIYSPPLYKSVDGGAHWSVSSGLATSSIDALAIAPSLSSTLYAGQNSFGLFKSLDGGMSWARTSNGLYAGGIYVSALAVDPTNADTVYVATPPSGIADTGAHLFKSTNGAAQWRQVGLTVPRGAIILSLTIDPATPSTIYATDAYGNQAEGGVYKSIDSGETWTTAQSGLSGTNAVRALAIDPRTPARIYAATQNGVYMSTDAAASWTPINSGLTDLDIWAISIDGTGSLLRVATRAGLFEYRVSGQQSPGTVALIEYVHAIFGDYFITSIPNEISKLDSGAVAGWTRTGFQFNAYVTPNANSAPVCRFFSTGFAPKSTHFYTPFPTECSTLRTNPKWLLESTAAFSIAVPAANGSCATGLTPVYRFYNNSRGGVPNHRYTTDLIVREQMIAQGWVPEGLGPNAVQMCSPP